MKRLSPLFVLAPLLLSCGGSSSSSSSAILSSSQAPSSSAAPSSSVVPSSSAAPSSSESSSVNPEAYSEKETNVRYVNDSLNYKTKLRFYQNAVDVPYMAIDEYYAMLLKGRTTDEARTRLTIDKDGDVYTVSSTEGEAIFNVKDNTMSSDNLSFFVSTKTYESGYNALIGTDGMPWIKIGDIEVENDPQKSLVHFNDYSIDLHGDEKSLYLPLPTLQDLFSDTNLICSFYNRKEIFVYKVFDEKTDSFGMDTYESSLSSDPGVEYATYLYNEMCFDYDVLLGRPTRSSLERYYDLSKGLDQALESRPLGKIIKGYLTDGTALGYATGLSLMGIITGDGGHTSISPFISVMYDPEQKAPVYPSWAINIYSKVADAVDKLYKSDYEELTDACKPYAHHDEIRQNRRDGFALSASHTSELRGEETYKKINSTAFIFIDDFMGDCLNPEEWKAYYAGTGALPYGPSKGGAVTSIFKGLEKAQQDNDVKNIVVDLSSNTGGSMDEMMYLVSLLTQNAVGETAIGIHNRVTNQRMKAKFLVDRNLDRVFDEKDAAFNPVAGKNIAVLMSQNGFSCGGISPILLHDNGIFTMGDISGGGCCSIFSQHTGVGLRTVRSSGDAIVDKNGKKIDEVRESSCDHKFEIKSSRVGDQTALDFSAFFKIEDIERVLAEHFGS